MKPNPNPQQTPGFTLIELGVILLTIVLLLGLLVSGLQEKKRRNLREACRNNLKQVGLAFKIWPSDSSDAYPMRTGKEAGGTLELISSGKVFVHFRVMSNELSTTKVLICPSDPAKAVARNFDADFTDRNVSYFIGLDTEEGQPQMFLAGDRNLAVGKTPVGQRLFVLTTNTAVQWTKTIHRDCGNILLADGSVQSVSSRQLPALVQNQGVATNRLAVP